MRAARSSSLLREFVLGDNCFEPCDIFQQALAGQSMNVTISTVASTRFDMEARGLNEVVRASVHYYNDEAEIERFCEGVRVLG